MDLGHLVMTFLMGKGGYYIGRGNNVYKGFEAGEILVCLRNQKINVGEGWG